MRVCIDASPLLVRSAGVKNYLWYWTRALRQHLEVTLFPPLGIPTELRHTAMRLTGLLMLQASHLVGTRAFTGSADVFHASNLVRRPPRNMRLTATLHDLTSLRMPELHTGGTKQADARFFDSVVRRADGVIAVSHATKRDAVELLGLDAARVEVIHSGVADEFFDAAARTAKKPYVLFVGTIEPRKNLDRLVAAWSGLSPALRRRYELIIAGPRGWGELPKGEYKYLGYVPETELPALTAGATVFCYPSLYEGFGFPVAQAMAAGTPVITSCVSSLPEVAGDAALLVDPLDTSAIALALEQLLTDEALRDDLARRGRARAAGLFRWDLCAARSAEFFARLIDQ